MIKDLSHLLNGKAKTKTKETNSNDLDYLAKKVNFINGTLLLRNTDWIKGNSSIKYKTTLLNITRLVHNSTRIYCLLNDREYIPDDVTLGTEVYNFQDEVYQYCWKIFEKLIEDKDTSIKFLETYFKYFAYSYSYSKVQDSKYDELISLHNLIPLPNVYTFNIREDYEKINTWLNQTLELEEASYLKEVFEQMPATFDNGKEYWDLNMVVGVIPYFVFYFLLSRYQSYTFAFLVTGDNDILNKDYINQYTLDLESIKTAGETIKEVGISEPNTLSNIHSNYIKYYKNKFWRRYFNDKISLSQDINIYSPNYAYYFYQDDLVIRDCISILKKIKVPEIINHIANDSKSDPTHLLTLSQTSSNLYQSIRLLRHLVKLEIIPDFYDYYGTFYNQFAKVTFIESQSGRKNINHYHKDKISQDKYLISNLLTGIYTETLTKSLLEEVDGIFRVFVMNLFITLKQIPYETLNNNKDYQRFNDFLNNNVYTRLTVDLKSLKQELETLL